MAAVATMTERASIGMLVGANTFRNPALVAKMITTLDHISGGRAVLGIGAAWFETEHEAFGLEFGESPGERLRWLRDALPIMRGMLDGERADGDRRALSHRRRPEPARAGPGAPAHPHRWLGTQGDAPAGGRVRRRVQYRRHGQTSWRTKDATLVGHCEAIGRDEKTVERTVGMGTPFIRDSREEAHTVMADIFADNGDAKTWTGMPVGTVEDVIEHCKPYLDAGLPAPHLRLPRSL